MKHNLANRPKFEISSPELTTDHNFVTSEVEMWFRGFEKELREKRQSKINLTEGCGICYKCEQALAIARFIEEVLGVEA